MWVWCRSQTVLGNVVCARDRKGGREHLENHANVTAVGAAVVEAVQQLHAGGRARRAGVRPPRHHRQQLYLIPSRLRVVLCALLHLRRTFHTPPLAPEELRQLHWWAAVSCHHVSSGLSFVECRPSFTLPG